MELKKLKEDLNRDLKSLGYDLYDVTYSKKDRILQILIDKKMDLKEVESLSKKVSSIMDLYDEDMDEYLLDVSSVGVERPIRNEEELKKAVGSYVYVKTKELKVYGDLKSFEDGMITLDTAEK
ncbi:MAG: hypothetical protein IKE38_05110, partial [Erysipelotrichaceae bacterium]|nr:hypothetical protein [Erysipelotrichaceae bacterium]